MIHTVTFLNTFFESGPGKDGIPYSGWRSAGETAVESLHDVGVELSEGTLPPIEFNDSVFMFPPTKESDPCNKAVHCTPLETRPLSLRLCSTKIASGVSNDAIKPVLVDGICDFQRGSIPRRQIINNIVEIESARIPHSLLAVLSDSLSGGLCSLLRLLDFMAAFPSVARQWIMMCLSASGAPQYFSNIASGLYANLRAFVRAPSGFKLALYIISGILHGCHLSGSIVAIAIEPLLLAIRKVTDDLNPEGRRGITRACADYVAIAIPESIVSYRSKRHSP